MPTNLKTDKMEKFLEKHNLTRIYLRSIKSLNNPVTSKETRKISEKY